MLNPLRAQPARLDSSAVPGLPPRLTPRSDRERAPITFAWMGYTATGRPSKHFHLVTLYRLERVGVLGLNAALVPSQYYGMANESLATMLRLRERALLPNLPPDYRWVGPEVIEDMPPMAASPLAMVTKPTVPDSLAGADRESRLRYARLLAADILRQRENA